MRVEYVSFNNVVGSRVGLDWMELVPPLFILKSMFLKMFIYEIFYSVMT